MWVIVKHISSRNGVSLPVIILDSQGEVLEFGSKDDENKMRELFEVNSDSNYKYEIKKI